LGFVGIGMMGAAMVQRLLACGWPVSVWNREAERYAEVAPLGAQIVASPAAVAAVSDAGLVCVLDGPAVENCCFGAGGIAEAQGGADILVDFSTINPDDTRDLAARLESARGIRWLDAPVSGGPPAALSGRLTVMVGGDAEVLATCRPFLDDLADNLTHMGSLGAGQTTKILNQAIVGASYVLMAEVLALAEATEIDPALLPKSLAGGLADGGVLQKIYPLMCAEDFDRPLGYARQLAKDLGNVRAFARTHGLDLPVVETAVARYAGYAADGNAMADSASVSRLYRRPKTAT
jgi:3-hydroxyisobutyrate dehydrogenase